MKTKIKLRALKRIPKNFLLYYTIFQSVLQSTVKVSLRVILELELAAVSIATQVS